jgi:hypothetical protein
MRKYGHVFKYDSNTSQVHVSSSQYACQRRPDYDCQWQARPILSTNDLGRDCHRRDDTAVSLTSSHKLPNCANVIQHYLAHEDTQA